MPEGDRRPFWAGEWAQTETALVVGLALTLTGLLGLLQFPLGPEGEGIELEAALSVVHLTAGILGIATSQYDAGRHAGQYNRLAGVAYLALGVAVILTRDPGLLGLEAGLATAVAYLLLGLVLAVSGFGLADTRGAEERQEKTG